MTQSVQTDGSAVRQRTSWRDDMVTAALCGWVVTGMALDAWAHQNASQLETFFTPWHGVLYSGFAVLMAWMAWKALAGMPAGYGLGLIGAATVGTGDYSTAQIGQMVGSLINMRYGREDELESDALGIRIMAEAGYDPRALIGVMETLARASSGSRQPEFFSTHPNPENRQARIRDEIAKRFPSGVPAGLKK